MKSWGINAVRIPMNEDCWLGINGVQMAYGGANYQSAILTWVNLVTQTNGMYAILDLHYSAPGSTLATVQGLMPDADHSPAFWSGVAAAYKGNGSVIFDLFNEPNTGGDGAADYSCWRDGDVACNINHYSASDLGSNSLQGITTCNNGTCNGTASFKVAGMQTLLTAVRTAGANNLVLLDGIGDAWNLGLWPSHVPTDTLSPPNVAAGWHFYDTNAGCDSTCQGPSFYLQYTDGNQGGGSGAGVGGVEMAGYPIIVGETGIYATNGPGWYDGFLTWLDGQGIAYFGVGVGDGRDAVDDHGHHEVHAVRPERDAVQGPPGQARPRSVRRHGRSRYAAVDMPPAVHTPTIGAATPAARELEQRGTEVANPRHAVRVAQGHRAAVDVRDLPGRLELRLVVQRGHRVGFVELPEIDVGHRELVMLHEPPDRRRDRDAHLLGRHRRELHAAEQAQDGQPAARGDVGIHHHDGSRAVRQLRGVAGRGRASRVYGAERRQARQRGIGARALVPVERYFLLVGRLGRLVGHLHRRREGHDLLGELARRRGRGDALLALNDVRVLRLAGDPVLLRDEVGRLVHRPPHGRHALLQGS